MTNGVVMLSAMIHGIRMSEYSALHKPKFHYGV